MARSLTPELLRFAILLATCERKSRSKLRERVASSIIDDCLDTLARPELCPAIIRFKPGGFDPKSAEMRQLAAEVQAELELIAPLVNAMAQIEPRRSALRARRA
jgi:hypothetical protein